jgi:tetratricopeptide (TPR) repeat protein
LNALCPKSLQSLSLLCELAALCGPSRMPEAADLVAPSLRDALVQPELPSAVCNEFAWNIARVPKRPSADYDAALTLVDRALVNEPGNSSFLNTRGVALYRAHRDSEAVEALRKSERSNAKEARSIPADQAFLALACLRLNRIDEAEAAYTRLQELMRGNDPSQKSESRAFLGEVMAHRQR